MNKLCINCSYYNFVRAVSMIHPDVHICIRENKTNLVTGKIVNIRRDCELERTNKIDSGNCGPSGKFFKEKL